MRCVAGHDSVYKCAELLTVTIFEQLGAPLPARAHHEDVLTRCFAFLTFERQGKSKRDVAGLVVGQAVTIVLSQDDRGVQGHGIGQRKTFLDIGKQRVVDMHTVLEAYGKRNDMTREVHAELKIAAEIKVIGIPDALEHLGDHIPNLVGNYETFICTVGTSIQRLLSRKVNGDIGNLLLWEPNVESFLDTQSHTTGHRKLARCTQLLNMFGFEWDVALLADSPNGDRDMNQQVLIGR